MLTLLEILSCPREEQPAPHTLLERAKLAVRLSCAVFLGSREKFRVQQLSSSPSLTPTKANASSTNTFLARGNLVVRTSSLSKQSGGHPSPQSRE